MKNFFLTIEPWHWGVGLLAILCLWGLLDEFDKGCFDRGRVSRGDRSLSFLLGIALFAFWFFVWLIWRNCQ